MLKVDNKEVWDLARDMQTYAKRTFPFAAKDTINTLALEGQKTARADLGKRMVIRNTYTGKGIRVKLHGRGLNVDKMKSKVGSIDPYMRRQELGGTVTKKGKHGAPITTSYAAGEPQKARPRTRLPKRANRMKNLKMPRGIRGANKRQRQRVAIMVAAKTGRKHVFLDLGKTKGIFKVLKRGKKHTWIKMLYNLSHPTTVTPPHEWLSPAVKEINQKAPKIFHDAMIKQLKRNRLFGYR